MPIRHIEFLDDRIIVHYKLTKPYEMSDVGDRINVLFDSIDKLPKLSEAPKSYGFEEDQEIHITKVNRTIVFRYGGHMENPTGPKDGNIKGPYLKD